MNIILLSDSYKVSHHSQYPPKTESVYSYFESRGGQFDRTVFFGLQYILEKFMTVRVNDEDIEQAAEVYAAHFGDDKLFNRRGWEYIVHELGGRLPVRIRAVPEGTVVPTHNVLMTAENTDPECWWLTNFLETLLSQVWYPTTVATLSWHARQLIAKNLAETGTPALVDFKLHDFGFRGASSLETAGIGGAAHLVNFSGTDTVPALTTVRAFYNDRSEGVNGIVGFSVPASEHSTMTSWGREHEVDAYRNMIETYGHMPFYSVVSDSYDLWHAARDLWGGELKAKVEAAEGTLVVRPDSGVPAIVVPQLLEVLGTQFGAENNRKGYKVLNEKVRVIQGDGMDIGSIGQVLDTMKLHGWSGDNVTFGMGGGLLQKVNRDTQKFAFKCSSAVVDSVQRDVWKDPVTDAGKVSKKGRLKLVRNGDGYFTAGELDTRPDVLETVFENGEITKRYAFGEVRRNARGE